MKGDIINKDDKTESINQNRPDKVGQTVTQLTSQLTKPWLTEPSAWPATQLKKQQNLKTGLDYLMPEFMLSLLPWFKVLGLVGGGMGTEQGSRARGW